MASYGDILRQVKMGQIVPVYLLAGRDTFLEDYFVKEIVEQFLPPGSKKMIYSLGDDRAEVVLAELNAYSLFQSRQVLVVRQAQRIAGKAHEELLAYAAAPNPEKCLLLIMEDYQPGKGLQKQLGKVVPVVDTRPPFPDKIRSWANYYAGSKGHTLEPGAVDELMDLAGDSVGHVVSELEKIFSQLDAGDTVSSEMVQNQVGAGKSFQLWRLQEALALRDTSFSLRVLVSLLEYGAQPTQIIAGLTALFSQLFFIQSRTTDNRVYTGLNKSVASKLGRMGQLYSPVETALILRRLLAADVKLKSSSVAPRSVLIPLVVGISKRKL